MGGKQAGKSRAGQVGKELQQNYFLDDFGQEWMVWDCTVVLKVIAVKNRFFYKLLKDSMLEYWREGTREQIVSNNMRQNRLITAVKE